VQQNLKTINYECKAGRTSTFFSLVLVMNLFDQVCFFDWDSQITMKTKEKRRKTEKGSESKRIFSLMIASCLLISGTIVSCVKNYWTFVFIRSVCVCVYITHDSHFAYCKTWKPKGLKEGVRLKMFKTVKINNGGNPSYLN
jgi:hypothetical protein